MRIFSMKTIILCHRVKPIFHLYHVVGWTNYCVFSILGFFISLNYSQVLNMLWIFLLMPSVTNEVSYMMPWTQMTGLSWCLKVDFEHQHYQLVILNRNLIVCLKQLLSGLLSHLILLFQNSHQHWYCTGVKET